MEYKPTLELAIEEEIDSLIEENDLPKLLDSQVQHIIDKMLKHPTFWQEFNEILLPMIKEEITK